MKKDGGLAFPASVRKTENYMDEGGYARCRTVTLQEGGMTLRDYFAAKAMQSIIAGTIDRELGEFDPVITSRDAYFMADAMLKERDKEET